MPLQPQAYSYSTPTSMVCGLAAGESSKQICTGSLQLLQYVYRVENSKMCSSSVLHISAYHSNGIGIENVLGIKM